MKKLNFITLFVCFLSLKVFAIEMNFWNLSGRPYIEKKQHHTRLVYFWATWCPDCVHKMTNVFNNIDNKKREKILAVNIDSDKRRAQNFVKKNNVLVSVVRDRDGKLIKKLKIESVPYWAIFSKDPKKGIWKLMKEGKGLDKAMINKML